MSRLNMPGMEWFVYRDGVKVSDPLSTESGCLEWIRQRDMGGGCVWMGEQLHGASLVLQRGLYRLACLSPDGPGLKSPYLYTDRGGPLWVTEITLFAKVGSAAGFREFALGWFPPGGSVLVD